MSKTGVTKSASLRNSKMQMDDGLIGLKDVQEQPLTVDTGRSSLRMVWCIMLVRCMALLFEVSVTLGLTGPLGYCSRPQGHQVHIDTYCTYIALPALSVTILSDLPTEHRWTLSFIAHCESGARFLF